MRAEQAALTVETQRMKRKSILVVPATLLVIFAALAFITVASARQSAAVANSAAAVPAPVDPLAAAARRAKEEKKHEAKPTTVFTNDNLPAAGVSTVGSAPTGSGVSSDKTAASTAAATATAAAPAQGETYWRDKFDKLNKKLEQDQSELGVMQRELGQLNLQNYSDPNKAMQQGYSHADIDKKSAEIDAKQREIDADKQAISDAQDDLRKSGGDPGWAR